MAQLAIAAVGALALGPVGLGLTTAGTGFMLGSLAYTLMAPGQKSYGPRLNDLKVTGTDYGAAIPWVAGNPRVAGQIIWASERRETATEEEQGKGGGPSYTSYTYDVDLLILLSENEIPGVSRVWSNGELIFSAGVPQEGIWLDMRVYNGSDDQLPDPTYEAAVGLGNAPAYRGMGTVLIQGLQLGNGGSIPNLTFEIGDYSASPAFEFGNQHLVNGSSGAVFSGEQYVIPESGATFEAWVEFNRSDVFTNTWVMDIASSAGGRVKLRMESNPGGTALYLYNLNGANPFYLKYPEGFVVGSEFHFAIDFSPLEYLSFARRTVATVYQAGTPLGSVTIDFPDDAQMSLSFKSAANFEGDIVIRAPRLLHSQRLYTAPFVPPANPVNVVVPGQLRPVPRPLAAVLHDLLERAQYPSTDLVVTEIFDEVRSLAIGQVGNTRSALEALQQVFFFECSAVDVISVRPRAINPVATIPFADLGMSLGSGGDDEPLALTLGNDLELPAQLALSYANMAGDYQAATEFSDRLLSGQQSTETIQTPVGLLPEEAKGVVDGLLMDRMASLATATLKLPIKYAYLEPGDVINAVNRDGRTYRLRVQSKTDALPVIELQCVLDDVGAIESAAITDSGYVNSETVIQPAGTLFEALDIPILRDADDAPGYYVAVAPKRAAETDKWPGAVVAHSWDGVSYTQLLKTTAQCVMGAATTLLGNWLGGAVFDEQSAVTVKVSGELASSTRDAMLLDESINALLLGSEVLRFRVATLLSPGAYLLSGLLRGQRGTEWAMSGHAVGERCVLLGNSLRRVKSQTNELGLQRQIKAVTLGAFLSSGTAKDFADTGVALKPFSPANPRALRGGGDIVVNWQRRTRLACRYGGAAPVVPLGEDSEAYRVRVLLDGAVLRTATVDAAFFRYTEAMQIQDGLGSSSAPQFEICQLSVIAGAGYPARIGIEALDAHDDFDTVQLLENCMHDGERFIAVRGGDSLRVYVSADGVVFEHVGTHASNMLGAYEEGVAKGDAGYAYFPKYYAYTGSGAQWYSALTPDLVKTFPPETYVTSQIGGARPLCMAWDASNHRYVRILEDQTFATSVDGLTWGTPAPMLLPEVPGGWAWYIKMSMHLFKSGGYWYVLHSAFGEQYDVGSLMLMRSSDLIVWDVCPGTASYVPPQGVSSWQIWGVFAAAAKDGVIVLTAVGERSSTNGSAEAIKQLVLRSTDGFNFEIVYEQPLINTSGQSDFGEIKPVGEGGFVASGRGGVLVSTDAGMTWTRIAVDPPPKQMRSSGSVVVASRATGINGLSECWYTTNGAMWRRSRANEGSDL